MYRGRAFVQVSHDGRTRQGGILLSWEALQNALIRHNNIQVKVLIQVLHRTNSFPISNSKTKATKKGTFFVLVLLCSMA